MTKHLDVAAGDECGERTALGEVVESVNRPSVPVGIRVIEQVARRVGFVFNDEYGPAEVEPTAERLLASRANDRARALAVADVHDRSGQQDQSGHPGRWALGTDRSGGAGSTLGTVSAGRTLNALRAWDPLRSRSSIGTGYAWRTLRPRSTLRPRGAWRACSTGGTRVALETLWPSSPSGTRGACCSCWTRSARGAR